MACFGIVVVKQSMVSQVGVIAKSRSDRVAYPKIRRGDVTVVHSELVQLYRPDTGEAPTRSNPIPACHGQSNAIQSASTADSKSWSQDGPISPPASWWNGAPVYRSSRLGNVQRIGVEVQPYGQAFLRGIRGGQSLGDDRIVGIELRRGKASVDTERYEMVSLAILTKSTPNPHIPIVPELNPAPVP